MTPEERTQRFYAYIWPDRALVLRTARFLTRSAAEAEDLAQEALMRAFRKIDQLDVTSNSSAWLTSILRHVRIDQTRLRAQTLLDNARDIDGISVPAAATEAEHDPRNVEAILDQMSDQVLVDALQALPEDICWTVLLVDVEQMSYEEAAGIMDIPPGTVKSRVHRGRQMLRDRLLTGNEMASRPGHETGRRVQ
jgi:RNA polymerase sigma-70 factor (ECF subfamily)